METEEFYVCAGICRIDPETSTCIGCGRPVGDLKAQANLMVAEQMPSAAKAPDSDDPAASPLALSISQ